MPDFDVAVVGGGFAGLIAANRAAELGLRVCVVEKGRDLDYPCNSRIATGVLSAAHGDPLRAPGELVKAMLDDTEGYADPYLAGAVAANLHRSLKWLDDEGARIVKVAMGGRPRWILAPPVPVRPGEHWRGRGPDQALKRLAANLASRGGQLRLATRALSLLADGGRCTGIVAEAAEGRLEITARCTFLADGGFQASPDLCRRFLAPSPDRLLQRNAGSGCGDALSMSEALGAALVGTDGFYGHLMAADAIGCRDLWPYPTLDSLSSSAIVVDQTGRRFMDEGRGGIPMANEIARMADPLGSFVVFDDRQWDTAGRLELVPPNPTLPRFGGTVSEARTIGELAERIGLPRDGLAETVETYNAAIAADEPGRLSPPRSPGRTFGQNRNSNRRIALSPIVAPPFRAIRLAAGISYTLGGIAIDAHMQVLTAHGVPIAGLFAGGSATGGLEGGPLPGYLGGLVKAITTGMIAGETMASTVRRRG